MGDGGSGAGAARKPIAFISHHNSQEKIARHLKSILERSGVTGWMAPDDIEPGLPFDRAIIEQVRKSDIIVLLFCAQSDQSKHVKRELMLAEDHDKLIYPVRLEAIEPAGLAYWLQDYQWIDWVDRRDATIERMLETVKRQVAAREAAMSASEEAAPEVEDAPGEAADAVAPPAPPPASPPAPSVSAPAPASPPMTAPMPIIGPADGPSADGDGDGGKGGIAGFFSRVDRNGWIAIGVVGVLLLVLLGIAIANMGETAADEDDRRDRAGDDDARDRDDDRGSAGGAFVIEPGMWEARTEDVTIVFPQLDPSVAEEMIDNIETSSVDRDCVSEAEARDPGVSLFDPDGTGNCELHGLDMEDGRITAELTCRPADMQGGEFTYSLRGGYDDDSVEGNVNVAIMPGTPNELRYRGTLDSRRIGECD